ncbi:BTB/POZ domain-containing protein At3g19850-like, partial [Phalaenopsis equestris]|uniref:BTB/POZ domain-containing protein At3g19850-like n=1 Tax=Phalaenopsis equestris TaxID=78828 RepID=UPI0009E5B0E3
LKIYINDHHTFFLNQSILCSFSGRLRKIVKSGKRRTIIRFTDFPGGPDSFELVSRFCYSNGRINMNPSNICILYCAAIFLEMNEEVAICNLLSQTETFLDGLFYWTWNDILASIRSCEPFFNAAESSGLLQKLVSCLIVKISANPEIPLTSLTPLQSSPSSSSSTDASGFSSEWWFEDLTALAPCIIEKMMRELGSHGSDSKNLTITRFLLHYLKSVQQRSHKRDYRGIADTAVHGVVIAGRDAFSCRGLFWVLSVVSRLGIGKESREKLEWLIGSMLDMATLDDLLVSGHKEGVYDVNLVIRLVRVFVSYQEGFVSFQRMEKVGRLVDKYLREISPDQSLKVSKFLAVAESLPDSARDLYDGVYRALDIYLESHPNLTFEERTILCRCLNYKKLTLETCKDLAKNPRIPPSVAVQALVSQQSKVQIRTNMVKAAEAECRTSATSSWGVNSEQQNSSEYYTENEISALDLQKMQSRVIELEQLCEKMRGQMSKLVRGSFIASPTYYSSRGMTKLC